MSFFGGNKKKEEATPSAAESEYKQLKTGGEIDMMVFHLVSNANDKEEDVKLTIARSLQNIGLQQPELVLSTIMAYVSKKTAEKTIDHGHRVQCLKILNSVLDATRDRISLAVAQSIGSFASKELMLSKQEVKPDWQMPVAAIICSLSAPFPDVAIDEMLKLFPPGKVPHYFVVKTLADIAASSGVALTLRLTEILGRVIPVLGAVQPEPMRWAFATALGRFAEAVLHFQSDAKEEQKALITDDMFRSDMGAAFDVIFNNWLNAKDAKVRFAVCEALGYMSWRIPKAAFDSNLPKLIPAYLAMQKKEKFADMLPVSQGLTAVLDAAIEYNSPALEPLLPQILQGLHPLACKQPDFKVPATVKNHNEILRCFEILCKSHLESVLSFVVNRFPTKEQQAIVGSLLILKHLVNACDAALTERKAFILSSVQALVVESDLKIRKVMLQLVVGMANQGYMILPGANLLVKYICQQAAISDAIVDKFDAANRKQAEKDPDAVTPGQIRNAATHILQVMATKVTSSHVVLWPYLLELISDENHSPAILVLCRCVAEIINIKTAAGEEVRLDFEQNVNLPSPQTILARLMILANIPFRKKGLGEAVIDCMGSLANILHPNIGKYWAEAVPALKEHLEAHTEADLNMSKWQDTLLKVWRETLTVVGAGNWLRTLAQSLTAQYKLYDKDSQILRLIHRYMGALIAVIDSKEVIISKLDLLLTTVNHKSDLERQGVAQGLGLAAAAHLDMVLPKLTEFLDKLKKKPSTGFFSSFGNNDASKEESLQKSTIILCYGYVVAYADPHLITSRLEAHVLNNLLPVMSDAMDMTLKENIIKAVDLIGKAVHASRLPEEHKFVLKPRDNLINGLLRYLGAKPKAVGKDQKPPPVHTPTNQLRVLALNAISTLLNLNPPVSTDLRNDILAIVLKCYDLTEEPVLPPGAKRGSVVKSPPPKEPSPQPNGTEESKDSSTKEDKDEEDEEESETPSGGVIDLVLANLNSLLSALIHMEPTVNSFTSLLTKLEYYLVSKNALERERACASYLVVLKKFVSKVVSEGAVQPEKELIKLGNYLALLIPRCTDCKIAIRTTAVENIQALFYIDQLLHNANDTKPFPHVKNITDIRNRIEASDMDSRLEAMRDLSALLCELTSVTEFPNLLKTLLKALNDPEPDSCLGVAAVLQALLERRGNELVRILPEFVSGAISVLSSVSSTSMGPTLRAFRVVTNSQFNEVMELLLAQTMPLNNEVVAIFKSFADGDGDLPTRTIQRLLHVINQTPLLEEKATPKVMVATSALEKALTLESLRPLVNTPEFYPAILCTLLMRIGTAQGVDDGTSSSDTIKAIKAFFKCSGNENLSTALNNEINWESEGNSKKYDEFLAKVIRVMCGVVSSAELKAGMMRYLSEYLNLPYSVGHRASATAILAQFVLHCGANPPPTNKELTDEQKKALKAAYAAAHAPLLKDLLRLLLPRVVDPKDMIRKQALRGLGNLEEVWNEEISQLYAASVLSSLTSGSEDQVATVAAEAVASLTRVARVVSPQTIVPSLINICFRMKPAFDRKESEIRKAAFNLFGELCRFGNDADHNSFMEQIHTNLTAFIVHVNDDDEAVREAALNCLRRVCKISSEEMFNVTNNASADPSNFDQFIADLAPTVVAYAPGRISSYLDSCVGYFKSSWSGIRANAAIFAASLLAASSPEARQRVNVASVCAALVKLLKEDATVVRTKTAKSIALLYSL